MKISIKTRFIATSAAILLLLAGIGIILWSAALTLAIALGLGGVEKL